MMRNYSSIYINHSRRCIERWPGGGQGWDKHPSLVMRAAWAEEEALDGGPSWPLALVSPVGSTQNVCADKCADTHSTHPDTHRDMH